MRLGPSNFEMTAKGGGGVKVGVRLVLLIDKWTIRSLSDMVLVSFFCLICIISYSLSNERFGTP